MEKNPAHRIMEAIGAPYGYTPEPREKGVAKRRAKRRAQRVARRANRSR